MGNREGTQSRYNNDKLLQKKERAQVPKYL